MSKDRLYLEHIARNIEHVQRIASIGKEILLEDSDKQAAVLYYLQTLSEPATRLSLTLTQQHPNIGW